MKRFLIAIIIFMAATTGLRAQEYNTGIGLRLGTGYGFTINHFLNKRASLEGLLMTRWRGFDITGLYEVHARAFDVDHLNWFYGFGAHIGFFNGHYVEWGTPGSTYGVFGIDGIIGFEYTFEDAPINLGIDLKPALNLIGYTGFWPDVAISVRYVF